MPSENILTPHDFLLAAFQAAQTAKHIFPEYAACEAALESAWGKSKLAIQGNNLFGRKQSVSHPVFDTIDFPTKEFLNGAWVTVQAHWVKYPDWESCFDDRMALLRRLSSLYGPALEALTGEDFIRLVSEHWSTDPDRADKVLSIHEMHKGDFS